MSKPFAKEPWSREMLMSAAAQSHSIAGVLSVLGCAVSGANYRWVHRLVARYRIDTSHFLGQGWLRGKAHSFTPKRPLSEILVENSTCYDLGGLKRRLVREGLMAYRCARCGITEWLGRSLALHLDHVNGVGDDHRLENIRLLCPNCHSQTDTYCGKNTARAKAGRNRVPGGGFEPPWVSPREFESRASAVPPSRPTTGTEL